MFHLARIKLTAWYLLIIMLVSISFSIGIYRLTTAEIDRIEIGQRLRIERGNMLNPPPDNFNQRSLFLDPELIAESKDRLKIILAIINLVILGISTGGGYFLASRTLKPISDMLDEQNRFITDASHELRTPLTSLKTEIEVNLRDKKLDMITAKRLLKSNLEEVNNLQVLSDSLIKLAQYQKEEKKVVISKLDLKTITNKAIKKVNRLADNKKIVILNKVNSLSMEGNDLDLIELIVIFLDNAVKYSPEKSKITLSSEKKDDNIYIHVIDQGKGVDEKEIPNLFNRFYRSDKSRNKSNVSGYGLGLSIAKQITERYHGIIKAKNNTYSKGMIFTVQFPIKQPQKLI
ncbi:MAG: HAMP domain-containing sensor histidine kinase [Candidatus Shapirobacteria bacterium]|nr:HAMP domain-containing sensor histidine kinase [Candidatus Shapirobacteria bacterium]